MAWRHPLDMLRAAEQDGYAVGAFNVHNDETVEALVRAAEVAEAPMFVQIGRAVISHMGLARAYAMARRFVDKSDVELVIHLDHGSWDEVFEAIRLGFTSLMFDGAHMSLDDNIRATRHVVEVAHSFGIPVEAELGRIPDADEEVDWASYYTDPDEAQRYVSETGIDTLAISVGIVHGVAAGKPQPLDIDRIRIIKERTGIPLVLHGASGIPDEEVEAAKREGVVKFNADTDLRHAFRSGIEEIWAGGDRQLEEAMALGRDRMVEATLTKIRLYGCDGRSQKLGSEVTG